MEHVLLNWRKDTKQRQILKKELLGMKIKWKTNEIFEIEVMTNNNYNKY